MNLIDLDRAVSEISQAWEDVGADPRRSPFFLIVGAGISYPPVKLAESIIEDCERTARQYQRVGTPNGESALERYSFWFGLAYPHARQRQKYFRQLIENQPISLANLRLAHLLSARKLTNLVVTTNFDDLLIKALRLFGQTPAVCDHPSTVARVDLDRDDIQIVYAHGSYLFYDLANLRGEVSGRAQLDRDTSLTMMGLLDNVLWNRSPIVVGYSGWDGDVLMSALKRRLRGGQPLGQTIYWCCYKRDLPARMPDWLRNSADVQFIVPEERRAAPDPMLTSRVSDRRSPTGAPPTTEPDPVLTAREVFEKLGQGLHAEDPPLLADPLTFLADQLAAALPKDESAEGGSDPYGFKRLIQRIRVAARQQAPPSEHELTSKLEAVTACIRRSEYADAVRAAAVLVPSRLAELTAEQRRDLLKGVALAGDALLADETIEPPLVPLLAQVLSVDIRLEEDVGPVPAGMAILFPARAGQMSFESHTGGRPRGAFSLALEQALDRAAEARPSASLQEILVEAGTITLSQKPPQCPAIVGRGVDIPAFGVRPSRPTKRGRGKLIALLTGINRYAMGANLSGCVNDVNAFAKLFKRHPAAFGSPTVVRLTDKLATASRIRKELQRLGGKARPDDVLVFAFSGHIAGSPEEKPDAPRTILVAHDYGRDDRGGVPLADVVEVLGSARAKHKIVILD